MKHSLLALSILALPVLAQPAAAQVPDVHCGALTGSPFMCVKNASNYLITQIQATVGDFGASWISIPGGPIAPGGTSVVNFGNYNGKCVMNVYVRTNAGQTHAYRGVDVCHNTSFVIGGW